ncbi:MAG: Asp-tRNA(Asn)/Glu-tRNA(Gln) amidotransferase subunit GatC [Opitutales bacterium]
MAEGFDIDHLAKLARLSLTAEEKALYASQLGQVLGHFQALAKADLPATADAARVVDESALRSDEPGPVLGVEAVTRLAPASRDGQISVPRVVDDES